jgi:Tfp pilus assembly protein PilN
MYVALNISSNNIKVLSLKGRQVKKWASAALADGLVKDGLILQPQVVGEAVNSLFKSTGIPRDRVVASISGLSFTYRFLSLPRMKASLLEEAIIRAARKEISLPMDELYLSWQSLPSKDSELSFFVVGVPRNLIDAAVATLKAAAIEPYLMDLRPLALARTADRTEAIVINLEPDCFDIVFITGGVPMVTHTLIPRGESATLEDNIRRLADELTKTATFYQSNNPEAQINLSTPLLLTGEMAADSTASGLLQAEVEYPIEPLVPTVGFPADFPVDSYAATIGLALKTMPKKAAAKGEAVRFTDININLLDGKYRKPKAKPVRARYIVMGVILALAVVLLYPLYRAHAQLQTDNTALEASLNDVRRELNIAVITNEDDNIAEDAITTIYSVTNAVKNASISILGTRGVFTTELELVTSLIPQNTLFTSIEIGPNDISIQGETDSVFTVVDYAAALEATGAFPGVRITLLDDTQPAVASEESPAAWQSQVGVVTFEILIQKYLPGVSGGN